MSTFDDERNMQPFLDDWYRDRGFIHIDRTKSCKQFDVIVSNGSDKEWKVEEKFLITNPYNNFLVELFQDLIKPDMGWFYHVDCDVFIWVYCGEGNGRPDENGNPTEPKPPLEIHALWWKRLKPFIEASLKNTDWVKFNICSKNYGVTLNYPVEWETLKNENIATTYYWNQSHAR